MKMLSFIPGNIFQVKIFSLSWKVLILVVLLNSSITTNAQNIQTPVVIIKVRDFSNNQPIGDVEIECASGDFRDLKGKTTFDGIYTTANNYQSKKLEVGSPFHYRCYKKGYEIEEGEKIIGNAKSLTTINVFLKKNQSDKIYISGVIVDSESKEILKGSQIKINIKGKRDVPFKASETGFKFEIDRDSLINPDRLELSIFHNGYEHRGILLNIPKTGDLLPQNIELNRLKIDIKGNEIRKFRLVGYFPYIGNFIRSKKEKLLGYIYTGIGLTTAGLAIYGGVRESRLRDKAFNTINQTSKNQILSDAERYNNLEKYSFVALGLSAIFSFATNIILESKHKESITIKSQVSNSLGGISIVYNF